MMDGEKIALIEEIKKLIAIGEESIEINPNYLEYFELEELENIKEELLLKKQNIKDSTASYIEEIYTKLI